MFGPFSQAIEKARASNELGELVIHTSPQVVGTFSTGLSILNTYISPSSDVAPYRPPRACAAFSATEAQAPARRLRARS
jgi:hypothetical protein